MVRTRSSSLDRSGRYSGGSNLASTVTSSLSTHWSKSSGGAGVHGARNASTYDYSAKSGIVSGVEPLSRTYLGSRVPTLRRAGSYDNLNGVGTSDYTSSSSSRSSATTYKYDPYLNSGSGGSGRVGKGGFRAFVAPEVPNFPADDEDETDIRRRVRQKFKKAYSAEPDSIAVAKTRALSGRTSDMMRMRDRVERQVRTASADTDVGQWEADGSAQVRGRTREVYSYQMNEPRSSVPPPLSASHLTVGTGPRAMSVEPYYYTSDLDLDPPSTRLNVVPVRARAASLNRAPIRAGLTSSTTTESSIIRRGIRRAHSVTCLDDEEYDSDVDMHIPRKRIVKRMIPTKVPVRNLKYEDPEYLAPYTDRDVQQTVKGDYRFHISELEKDRRKGDISTYILPHDEKFEPDNIEVKAYGDGKRQVTYSRQTLSGHASDPREASAALDNVVRRTKFMQDSMTELEKFVRRNRSLFPEDTTIYQDYKYYLLSEEQLRKMGEKPDAEVYGVTIIEKLVVPAGTEIAHILKRFYGKTDVEVEYSRRRKGAPVDDESVSDNKYLRDSMRKKVELEFESRERGNGPSHYLPTYQSPIAGERDVDFKNYAHLYTRITPRNLKKIYGERGEGADFEASVARSRRSGSAGSGSVYSDATSRSGTSSRRQKRYDTQPNFTAKLRPKRCLIGQTVRFNVSVSGIPDPEITWYKGNKAIQPGGRISKTNNYGLASLEIANVMKDDAGLYSVRATNTEGEVACSASLDVSEIEVDDQTETRDGTRRPFFVMEPQNRWVEIGGRATLEAQASGRPVPTFSWLHDNIPVRESDRIRMFSDERGNAKIQIKDVQEPDGGLYFCAAENKAGKTKACCTLRVAEKGTLPDERRRSFSRERTPTRGRRSRSPSRSWSKERTPTFDRLSDRTPVHDVDAPFFLKKPPIEVTVKEGDPLTLTSMVDGDPKPSVKWMKGVRELSYTNRHRIVVEGGNHLLQIKSTMLTDPGQYICVAENSRGKAIASTWVNMIPREEGEDEETFMRRLKTELPDSEYEALIKGELGKIGSLYKIAPYFIKKLPLESEISEGESLEMRCKVSDDVSEYGGKVQLKTKVTGDVKVTEEAAVTKEAKVKEEIDVDAKKKPEAEKPAKVDEVKPEESKPAESAAPELTAGVKIKEAEKEPEEDKEKTPTPERMEEEIKPQAEPVAETAPEEKTKEEKPKKKKKKEPESEDSSAAPTPEAPAEEKPKEEDKKEKKKKKKKEPEPEPESESSAPSSAAPTPEVPKEEEKPKDEGKKEKKKKKKKEPESESESSAPSSAAPTPDVKKDEEKPKEEKAPGNVEEEAIVAEVVEKKVPAAPVEPTTPETTSEDITSSPDVVTDTTTPEAATPAKDPIQEDLIEPVEAAKPESAPMPEKIPEIKVDKAEAQPEEEPEEKPKPKKEEKPASPASDSSEPSSSESSPASSPEVPKEEEVAKKPVKEPEMAPEEAPKAETTPDVKAPVAEEAVAPEETPKAEKAPEPAKEKEPEPEVSTSEPSSAAPTPDDEKKKKKKKKPKSESEDSSAAPTPEVPAEEKPKEEDKKEKKKKKKKEPESESESSAPSSAAPTPEVPKEEEKPKDEDKKEKKKKKKKEPESESESSAPSSAAPTPEVPKEEEKPKKKKKDKKKSDESEVSSSAPSSAAPTPEVPEAKKESEPEKDKPKEEPETKKDEPKEEPKAEPEPKKEETKAEKEPEPKKEKEPEPKKEKEPEAKKEKEPEAKKEEPVDEKVPEPKKEKPVEEKAPEPEKKPEKPTVEEIQPEETPKAESAPVPKEKEPVPEEVIAPEAAPEAEKAAPAPKEEKAPEPEKKKPEAAPEEPKKKKSPEPESASESEESESDSESESEPSSSEPESEDEKPAKKVVKKVEKKEVVEEVTETKKEVKTAVTEEQVVAAEEVVAESAAPAFEGAPAFITLKDNVKKEVTVSQQEQRITMAPTGPDFEFDEADLLAKLKTEIPKGENAVIRFTIVMIMANGEERVIPVDEANIIMKIKELKPQIVEGARITIKKTIVRTVSVDGKDIPIDQAELIKQLESQFPEGGQLVIRRGVFESSSPEFDDTTAVIKLKGDVSQSVNVSRQESSFTIKASGPDFKIDEPMILGQFKTEKPKGQHVVMKCKLIFIMANGEEKVIPVDETNIIAKIKELKPQMVDGGQITIKKTVIRSTSVDGKDFNIDEADLIKQLQSQLPQGAKITVQKGAVQSAVPAGDESTAVIQLKGDVSKSVKVSRQEQSITLSASGPDFKIDEPTIMAQLKTERPKGQHVVVEYRLVCILANGTEREIPCDEATLISKITELKPEMGDGGTITIKKTTIRTISADGEDFDIDENEFKQQLLQQLPEGGKVTVQKKVVKKTAEPSDGAAPAGGVKITRKMQNITLSSDGDDFDFDDEAILENLETEVTENDNVIVTLMLIVTNAKGEKREVPVDEATIIEELNKLKPEMGGGGKVVIRKTIVRALVDEDAEVDREELITQMQSQIAENAKETKRVISVVTRRAPTPPSRGVKISKRQQLITLSSSGADFDIDEAAIMGQLKVEGPDDGNTVVQLVLIVTDAKGAEREIPVDEDNIIAQLTKLKPEIGKGGKVVIKKTIIRAMIEGGGDEPVDFDKIEQLKAQSAESGSVVVKKKVLKSGESSQVVSSPDVQADASKNVKISKQEQRITLSSTGPDFDIDEEAILGQVKTEIPEGVNMVVTLTLLVTTAKGEERVVNVEESNIIAELTKLKPEIGGGGKVIIKKTIIRSTSSEKLDKDSLLEQLKSEMPEGGRVVIKKKIVKSGESGDGEIDEEKIMEELKSQLPEGASVSIQKRVVKSGGESSTVTSSSVEETAASKIVNKAIESAMSSSPGSSKKVVTKTVRVTKTTEGSSSEESESESESDSGSEDETVTTKTTVVKRTVTRTVVQEGGEVQTEEDNIVRQPRIPTPPPSPPREVKPIFEQRLKDQTANPVGSAEFKVKVLGEPEATVTWQKDGAPLPESDRYEFRARNGTNILEINDICESDAGIYECIAENAIGKTSCSCKFTVIAAAKKDGAITVAKKLVNQTAAAGATVKFECTIKGGTKYKWTKDGQELVAGDRITIVGSDDGVHSVTIATVTKADEGEYKLTASKDDASESTAGKLKIEGEGKSKEGSSVKVAGDKSKKDESESEESGSEEESASESESESESSSGSESESEEEEEEEELEKPSETTMSYPEFVSKLADIWVNVGEPLSLECKVTGIPLTETLWLRDGQEFCCAA